MDTSSLFVKDTIRYYKCRHCTFRFSRPEVNLNDQTDIESYEEAYINYLEANPSDRHNFNSLLAWISRQVNLSGKKLLDIGCGSGKFVNFLRENRIDAVGLEPSKPLFDRYLKGNSHFYNFPLQSLATKVQSQFDVVTLCDVLEHVPQPRSVLEIISDIQPIGGHVIIEIPVCGTLPSIILGKYWHFYNKYHLSYFSKAGLIRLLREHGYTLCSFSYRGKYFQLSYILKYILYFVFGKNRSGLGAFLERKCIFLNTYDLLLACFEKVSER
ncbi:MAG: class I SAM-dependent methyltransferase [Acidobacteria bacterium]|nr:class I SAM-dependent methyltransferase [Acidobacteriota bacterium]MBI3655408.1 class I SAM-dependent methyltransferase [Acidobacteriota bacterium]